MCNKMVYNVLVWMCFLIAAAKATEVELSSKWKPNFGWETTCTWKLFVNDSLQSVRLSEDDRQFMIYRPELHGQQKSEVYYPIGGLMRAECRESVPRGLVGSCIISLELHQPQTNNLTYSCEVSGERPKFFVDKKSLVVSPFVPPSDAIIEVESKSEESGRVSVNCSSSGSPAPRLTWTIGEQKVPPDFTDSFWNMTSKLWHVWSVVSYTHTSEHQAVCTPEISWAGDVATGKPAKYNSADTAKSIPTMVFVISIPLLLLR